MIKHGSVAGLLLFLFLIDISSAGNNRYPRPTDGSGGPTCKLVPTHYRTIQYAIDAAFDGDTILVREDEYSESLRFRGKAITLASMYLLDGDTTHIARTILSGGDGADSDSASVVYFIDGEDTNSVLCGFTITGGGGTMHLYPFENNLWYRLGGGIYCDGAGPRIVHNIIKGNTCVGSLVSGGGIKVLSESPETFVIIEGNVFAENVLQADSLTTAWANKGAGASVRVSARIQNNIFEGNIVQSTSSGAAGLIFGQMNPSVYGPVPSGVIRNNIFRYNRCIGYQNCTGGALYLHSSGETIVAENLFVGNSSSREGGGISVATNLGAPPHLTVFENNVIAGNSAQYGGGILTWNSRLVLINNTIVQNNGAGVYSWDQSWIALMNNIVWGNSGIQIDLSVADYSGHCFNNDVQGGWPGVGTLSVEPRFVNGTYSLSDSSECIGAGIASVEIHGTNYQSPSLDFEGSTRPDPPGSQPDLGALECPLALGVTTPALAITPPRYDFLNVLPGSVSDTLMVGIRNRATVAIDIRSLTFGRAEFGLASELHLPMTLKAFERTELALVFRPILPGVVVEDTLVIGTTDDLAPQMRLILKGRGSGLAECARSGIMYGTSSGSAGTLDLHEIDRSTGKAKHLSSFSPIPRLPLCALTLRGRDTLMYAAFGNVAETRLVQLSSRDGDVYPVATVPVGDVTSMAFSADDRVYLATSSGGLHRLETLTSEPVLVGTTGHAFTGLAFNPATGTLWATLHDTVFTVDPVSGDATTIGWGQGGIARSTIAFNMLGVLYGLYGTALVTVGTVWGDWQAIGSTGVQDLKAIVLRNDVVSDVEGPPRPATTWNLEQNYPNPFNPSTKIRFTIAEKRLAKIGVYDLLGREVATLVNEVKDPGTYAVEFDATGLSSGFYIYRLTGSSFVQCRRMLLIK